MMPDVKELPEVKETEKSLEGTGWREPDCNSLHPAFDNVDI